MKRHLHEEDAVGNDDQEEPEMDVDHEEKIEADEEEQHEKSPQAGSSVPFLDAFYGLSSPDPRERAQAAQDIMQYCLLGPDSNLKDASYALKRLLNGLCSGRAAARQGNASALASFVKLASQQGIIHDIQSDTLKEGEKEVSELVFIRDRLIAATEPGETQGKRKNSEERDFRFGRVFGILAVVRSGTLLPMGEKRPDIDEIVQVTTAYVKDLAELYAYKKWMREPAAHAVGALLNSFYSVCSQSTEACKIVHHLVNDAVVPELLTQGDNSKDAEPLFATYSAEQIAMALNIQTHASFHAKGLPKPINEPVLTAETLPYLSSALSDTSSVTQPRLHLVWDALCLYISDPVKADIAGNIEVRRLRQACPVGSESVHDLIEALMRKFVMDRLLGLEQSGTASKQSGKTTHERTALALCLVRSFSGVEYISSITGRTQLILDSGIIGSVVLNPGIVDFLFLNTITAGTGGHKKQAPHLLKPLALQILDSIVAMFGGSNETMDQESRKLAFASSFLSCDPRFDSKTKTSVVAQLIEGNMQEDHTKLWNEYVDFLECHMANAVVDSSDSGAIDQATPYKAQGYLELLFNFAKILTKREAGGKSGDYAETTTRRILGDLMASAFFDCHSMSDSTKAQEGKKKKGRNASPHPAVASALLIRKRRPGASALPYSVRAVASARFYSLLAESTSAAAVRSSGSEKDWAILNLLTDSIHAWEDLEKAGAVCLAALAEDQSMDDKPSENPKSTVSELRNLAEQLKQGGDEPVDRARMKWSVGLSLLASTLYVYLLSCCRHEKLVEEDLDADDDNNAGDICEFLADLKEVSMLYSGSESGDDPLSALAELCVNILNSPLAAANPNRGGSSKLLRDAVKYAWTGGLTLSTVQNNVNSGKESSFLGVLLESIGAEERVAAEDDGSDSEEEGESDSDEETKSVEDKEDRPSFLGAAKDLIDKDDVVMREQEEDGEAGERSSDVVLDPGRLQSFLEEDSDADLSGGELEHHAGADGALAKLIQLKQEARKVGQMARERAEISQQLHCTMLLEVLLQGRADGWGSLLYSDEVLKMIVPILHYRKDLEKSLSNTTAKGSEHGTSEKRALIERLTSLLQTKLLKVKHTGLQWHDSVNVVELCSELALKTVAEMKGRVSKEHRGVCSSALTAMVRAIPSPADKIEVAAKVYAEAVLDWASKRTTRLDASMFDDLIRLCPLVAQASLASPLAGSASAARSTFLKCESFRLLSLLYNAKINTNTSELEKMAFDRIVAAVGPVVDAFVLALGDSEMKKAKRARGILKALERIFDFLSSSKLEKMVFDRTDLKELLVELKSSSDSQGVVNSCDKLLGLMNESKENTQASPDESDPTAEGNHVQNDAAGDDDDDEDGAKDSGGKHQGSKKKRNKKKSKKRKR